ncbi:alpha-L-fucosidase [Actinomadura darangshiensis]|uniref:alpha-L-fucosidase n=1 Tax=Actinomadura darangshiensis TaxID=705336 RepID=A0A4V2YX75_9ACTN|nr:alpha-L-fucosidase [Actinomadura darangshiensis]TDD88327.1 alpha-L-fucosidase [Actinomadura darangshiensis]
MFVLPSPSRRKITALTAAAALVLALCAALAARATPARAELFNPRQKFLRTANAGLFLHWGMRTAPAHTDCAAWEKDVTDGGWDPRYWVDEARKLHAQYLVLASFHSRLGYARAWPSTIPGTCSTKRDFLGELIKAADAEGLRVVLYMTDDPKWYWEGLPEGQSWMDSAAYSAYKGKAVDLHTREGFGEFSYDNFIEVMHDYPKLSGFWIDNDNEYWEDHGLYERIREERPDMTLSNNNEDTPIMDMVSHEQKTGMTPPYDYPQAVWTPQPRLTEGEWKLPTKGAWWYDGTDADVDTRITLGRLIANAGSSIKSLMAETAMVNGRFPSKQEAFNDFADGYLDEIWESIHGVQGGGYMYGGLQPGFWNDGAHGVTTIGEKNPNRQYVHVLTRPETGDSVTIRDNGYKIRRVTNLRTGERMRVEQGGGSFTIKGITGWDDYDTVFRVDTAGRHGIYPSAMVTATASASTDGHPAASLVDHDYLTWWDKGDALPVTIDLRLPHPLPVKYLAVNQREWSPTYNRETFGRPEDSARIKDYKVYVSDDGMHWGEPVKTGVMESERGARFIDLNVRHARYVRLEVDSIWAAETAPRFYNKLQIDEMWLGHSYVR